MEVKVGDKFRRTRIFQNEKFELEEEVEIVECVEVNNIIPPHLGKSAYQYMMEGPEGRFSVLSQFFPIDDIWLSKSKTHYVIYAPINEEDTTQKTSEKPTHGAD